MFEIKRDLTLRIPIQYELEVSILRETDPEELEYMGGDDDAKVIDGKYGGYIWQAIVTGPGIQGIQLDSHDVFLTPQEALRNVKPTVEEYIKEKFGNSVLL